MKKRNQLKRIAIIFLCITLNLSCSDWLAVDMEDAIMEEKLYETNEGYLASLNGVYTKMNETYGSTLSLGVIDVMAQYYNVAQNSNHNFHAYANYDFYQDNFENTSGNLWTNLYGLIANINTLLEHCDKSGAAIKQHYYPYIKGEALALRAMLHFDLLRIFGPIYSETTSSNITIPYQETTSKEIQPLLTAGEILDKVTRDLLAAIDLLKEDRIRSEGILNTDSDDPNETANLRFRQYRLNYYAVQTVLARVQLWKGDKNKAYELAKEIITENEKEGVFPWTIKANVQSNSPDRLFSSEVIFALYQPSRINLYDTHFKPTAQIKNCLTFAGSSMDEGATDSKLTYFYSDMDDLRRGDNMWSFETLQDADQNSGSVSTQKALCFSKYADVPGGTQIPNSKFRYMIPLIRLSEIYLIAAECSNNLTEAVEYINEIRKNRNCIDLVLNESDTKKTIQEYITAEFAREVIGEGQLYFYYKRHAMETILSGTTFSMWGSTYGMSLQNYVWPLPKVEKDKRQTN